MSSMDGSNSSRPPSYSYENAQQRSRQQCQTYTRGYGPQPTECEPLLGGDSGSGMDSGRSTSANTIRLSMFNLLALIAIFVCIGSLLNPFFNSAYHEMVRYSWAREVKKHEVLRLQMYHDEAVWEERRIRHEEEERQRRDDEIKKRDGISWEGLAAARCSRYATREYTAVLANVPLGFDALEEGRNKTVNIHGRDLLPSRCEDQGVCGRVTGRWYVDFEEPRCVTWWSWFDDWGCYSSGVRVYHSKLENLEHYDLWPVMCSSTPREVNGVHYDGPTSCADFGQGPWGVWHIPDSSCP